MKSCHPRVSIVELVQRDRILAGSDFEKLRDRIRKAITRQDHQTLNMILAECNTALSGGGTTIASTKGVQWRIVNYVALIDAALVIGMNYIVGAHQIYKTGYSLLALLLEIAISIVATIMLCKTESDLDYYRMCTSMYEVLRNDITNVLASVENAVVKKHPRMEPKTDRFRSAKANRAVFSSIFHSIIWIAFIVSAAVILILAFTCTGRIRTLPK
jgi:hypothetical protein